MRIWFFFVIIVSFFSLLILRLADLQVIHGQEYLEKAEGNRFFTRPVLARRGVILDRYGEPLVWNAQTYKQLMRPESLYGPSVTLSRDDALKVLASTASASVKTELERQYRYALALSHVIGYVGEVTAEDLQRDETLKIGQRIGKAGLEYIYEKDLRGIDGNETYEIDALGSILRKVDEKPAIPGQDIPTSLDPYLTQLATNALQGLRGVVIITDADTGEVISLTSTPSFDPNILSQSEADPEKERQRKEQIRQLFQDPQKLFFDRAISGAYPPGSVFKLVTALAALEHGKVDASTQVVDEGRIKIGEYEFGNWYFRQYGRVEGSIGLVRAIARSNDIYFYKAAEWTGPTSIAEVGRELGLGEKTGIDLPAETRGIMPDPEWKERVMKEKWFLGDTYHMGIGQGNILTSPIQVAQYTQAIANRGNLCKVSIRRNDKRECHEVNVKQSDLDVVLDGMIGACSSGGTAFPFFPYNAERLVESQSVQQKLDSGVVACKTGTAEFGSANEQGYRRTHAWLTAIVVLPDMKEGAHVSVTETATTSATLSEPVVGAVQSENILHQEWKKRVAQSGFPRRVTITVMIESDEQNLYREGSRDAAPIARKIVDWIVQK